MVSFQEHATVKMENNTPSTRIPLHLPIKLIVRIGEFLADDLCFGVLATLNLTGRIVQEETRSVLYKTMFLAYSKDLLAMFRKPPKERPSGWNRVR